MNPSIITVSKLHYHSLLTDIMSVFTGSPLHIMEFDTDEAGVQRLHERYRDRVFRANHSASHDRLTISSFLLRFAENEFALVRGDGCNDIEILAPTHERADALHRELREAMGDRQKGQQPSFSMLRHDSGDISCEKVENLPGRSEDEFMRLCYGQDITTWIDSFRDTTISRTGGITLLDGPPGTGKTSLITQLVLRLSETHAFYVLPVTQAAAFAAADFIPFWQRENTREATRIKVVIVEDADRLLRHRGDDSSGVLAAMLNVADGLAGRMLRLHIVCTINCPIDHLDPAILRPGRLLNHRRLDLLDKEAAVRVARHSGRTWAPDDSSRRYALAEVLNEPVLAIPEPKRILGFMA